MADDRPHKVPGPDHPITIKPSSSRVVVRSGDVVIAETDKALELREAAYPVVYYVPLEDVHQELLGDSDHQTYCPFKGDASYFDVNDGKGTDLAASVWYYAEPFPAVSEIKGHVAFYADRVSVTTEPN